MKKAATNMRDKALISYVGLQVSLSGTSEKLESKYATWASKNGKLGKAQMISGFMVGAAVGGGTIAPAALAACDSSNSATTQVVGLINNGAKFVAALVAAASVLMLMWAAFLFITAGGNSGQASKAKGSSKNVLIGFGLAAAIY